MMPPEAPEAALLRSLEGGWAPQPGRQAEAYHSPADVVFYGGAAGGGKTDLLLGLAHTRHRHSIIYRREYVSLRGLEERARELFGGIGTFKAEEHLWRLADGRIIEFGAAKTLQDAMSFQGRPHDFIGFDEVCHFNEAQFRFLSAWLRTAHPGQRTRVVAAGNPPTDATGDWVISYWGPWLDLQHPNPAEPGELRWFATLDGRDVEVENGEPFDFKGERIKPLSRTFLPAKVEDNAYLMSTGYKAQLQSLPEPLRTQMLQGNFGIAQEDDPWQLIPTAWVIAAQERWRPEAPGPMDGLGVDVARGGRDKTVLSPRHGAWFGPQMCVPGAETPTGDAVVALIAKTVQGRPKINVDVIGVGYSVVDLASQHDLDVTPCNGAGGTQARDRTGQFGFANLRAFWWWSLREALDPANGHEVAIPPDRELRADLTAPKWRMTIRGVQVESKEDIIKRIGRSPDKGDALVYAWAPEPSPHIKYAGFLRMVEADLAAAKARGGPASGQLLGDAFRLAPPTPVGAVQGLSGASYRPNPDGTFDVSSVDAPPLIAAGFRQVELTEKAHV